MKYNGDEIAVVWLDLDDTLIDFHTNSRRALHRLYKVARLDSRWPVAEEWIDCYERYNQRLWAEYAAGEITRDHLRMERFRLPLVEGGYSDEEGRRLSARFDTEYLDYLAEERELVPGALGLLEALRRAGVTIGILSNGFAEVQYRKIRRAGLEPYIDIVVLSDDIDVNKPDVRLYRYAQERAGVAEACRHLMIGDNPDTDIRGAVNAGWYAVLFDPQLKSPDITPRVAALDGLHALLGI